MPWIALGDEAYLDIINNTVHKLNLNIPSDGDCCGSVDNLLFLTRGGGGCFLADPFSSAVHPVADLALFFKQQTRKEMFSLNYYGRRLSIKKVVVDWPQGSSVEPVVATLLTNSINMHENTIFVCRAGTDTVGKKSYRTMSVDLWNVLDIAFFHGNLYAISTCGQLHRVEIRVPSDGNPVITNVKELDTIGSPRRGSNDDYNEDKMVNFIAYEKIIPTEEAYLVESGDKLLKLNPWIMDSNPGKTVRFTVYEAHHSSPFKWNLVRSLCGRALFLGRHGSNFKSVPVGDGHYCAQEDCIYFVHDSGDFGIYNVKSRKMMGSLVPDTEVLPQPQRPWIPTWVFPRSPVCKLRHLD
ncbi:hypothetical protein HU200_015235 [Digitaria exilis]|uniref:KIB1-4 beta-propeller domain-containing protein n=1 Tax=Digitaria exilis TaxID=1010633 RepID=A0A835FAE0_9POAL|nr:hypothetical protein HU200_015235 [Digitaria exilis]